MDAAVDIHQSLELASRRHATLRGQFAQFARTIESEFGRPRHPIVGLSVDLREIDVDRFEIHFAGRRILVAFTSEIIPDGGVLDGVVRAYLMRQQDRRELLFGFTFRPDGRTSVIPEPDGDPLFISLDASTIRIGLHIVRRALSARIDVGAARV